MFSFIFNQLLYRPFFNGLIFIYSLIPDFGIAIIILTIIVRLILYPLMQTSLKSQGIINKIQPEMKEIQKKHKNNKEEQMKATMAMYKKHQISPFILFVPFLTLFIQIPILIALFYVFKGSFDVIKPGMLYDFVSKPSAFSPLFLWVINLSIPNLIFALIAGFSQYVQAKLMAPKIAKNNKNDFSAVMSKQMMYFLPFFTVIIAARMPAGLSLYWITSTLFTIFQQKVILKKDKQSDANMRIDANNTNKKN